MATAESDRTSPDCVVSLRGHTDSINAVTFYPEERLIFSASNDKKVHVFHALDDSYEQWKEATTFHCNSKVTALAFDGSRRRVIAGLSNGMILLLSVGDQGSCLKLAGQIDAHKKAVTKIMILPENHDVVVSVGKDKNLFLYDQEERSLGGGRVTDAVVHTFEYEQQGRRVFLGTMGRTIPVLVLGEDYRSFSQVAELGLKEAGKQLSQCGHTASVRSLLFDEKESFLFSGSFDKTVCGWQIPRQVERSRLTQLRCRLDGHRGKVKGLAWDREHRLLFSTGDDRTVIVWDATLKKVVAHWMAHEDWVLGCELYAEAGLLFTWGRDKTIKLWKWTNVTEMAIQPPPSPVKTTVET
ncbi:hypothetical protein KIPB_001074 [Kipferlia bialata]|uniref:Uncharacterized protein n=1 Tax=Kipferlia bialata TaxID=797122 RepID=A0A9K3CRI1_9EUKA|nr:hypothetical protein KIPB_001074 [Kipferlia bialata]|eukprot:g1074.t1